MIKEKIIDILKKQIVGEKFSEKTEIKNIPKWDSLNHLNILFAIEKHFKIKFTIIEIGKFKNVEEIINSVKEKTK